MVITNIDVFAFKYDHHYRLGGHTDSPNRLPGTDYYFEPQWRHAYSRLTESCLVKITTDSGIVGWGEAQSPLVPEVPATLIAKLLGPAILGMDATDPEAVYEKLYHLNHVRGHTASFTIDAITAIDLALWDLKGKALNRPVNELIGTVKSRQLPLYVSGLRRPDLASRAALASEKVSEGFAGVKIFKGDTAANTLQECKAIREAIGPNAVLAFDAICAHDYPTAYEIGRGLDELKADWFEAPLDPEDVAGHAKLAQAIKTPLAIGEPLRTVREFGPWVERGAMKIAQPDIVRCGISGGKKIIALAETAGMKTGPHIGVCTAIGVAASWHVASVLNYAIPQEHQLDMFAVANKVLNSPLMVECGKAIVPMGPGFGIDVDEEFIRANSAETWTISFQGITHHTSQQKTTDQ